MARNQEKANLMFNKWSSMKEGLSRSDDRRPYLASECKVLPEAEKWRRQIIRDITKRVADIQNAGLGEARIRDTNDEINKLLREKGHWERQIKALGGPDHALTAPRLFDAESVLELAGSGGYKYFGAARDLPGVRELFSAAAASTDRPRRSRAVIARNITPDYYGYRDEDDGALLAAEAAAEPALVAAALAEWQAARGAEAAQRAVAGSGDGSGAAAALAAAMEVEADEAALEEEEEALASASFRAHVPLPSQRDIEAALLAKRKAVLRAKYGGGGGGGDGGGGGGGGEGAGAAGVSRAAQPEAAAAR